MFSPCVNCLPLCVAQGDIPGGYITDALRAKKELQSDIYSAMSATLGVPPQPDDKFVWDYYDKDEKAGRWEGSAKQFYGVRRKCSFSVG